MDYDKDLLKIIKYHKIKPKSDFKRVGKTWGSEIWMVNDDEYCFKFLLVDRGKQCSYHYHPIKKETFWCLHGTVALTIDDTDYLLNPVARPKTITPGHPHQFRGITDAILIEVSTHHDDKDVIRIR